MEKDRRKEGRNLMMLCCVFYVVFHALMGEDSIGGPPHSI